MPVFIALRFDNIELAKTLETIYCFAQHPNKLCGFPFYSHNMQFFLFISVQDMVAIARLMEHTYRYRNAATGLSYPCVLYMLRLRTAAIFSISRSSCPLSLCLSISRWLSLFLCA